MIRPLVLGAAIALLLTTPGCGAMIVGYLVYDHVERQKAIDACRSNLNTVNQARIAKGQEPFPDQCVK